MSDDEKKPSVDRVSPEDRRRSCHHHHSAVGTSGRRSRSPVALTEPAAVLVGANSPQVQRAIAGQEKLQKMMLAHEVALNKDFRVQDILRSPSPGSLEATLSELMHQVFWDNLRASLNADPPDYNHALKLLDEIRQALVTLLPMGENSAFGQNINSNLDMSHLHQQIENDAFDFKDKAAFVIDTMSKLCAPARDNEIAELRRIDDIVVLFREVFRVLQDMKLDMLNYTLMQARPLIDQHAMEYELQMFDEFAATQEDALKNTREWLLKTANKLLQLSNNLVDYPLGTESWKISPTKLLQTAFRELLTWKESFPETFASDFGRLESLRERAAAAILTAAIHLVTISSPGVKLISSTGSQPPFPDKVKTLISQSSDFAAIAQFVISEISPLNKLDKNAEEILKSSILALENENNPVRVLLVKRLKEFVDSVLAGSPGNMPVGLSVLSSEFVEIVRNFSQIVSRNQRIFGKHYTSLISAIAEELQLRISPSSPQSHTSPQLPLSS